MVRLSKSSDCMGGLVAMSASRRVARAIDLAHPDRAKWRLNFMQPDLVPTGSGMSSRADNTPSSVNYESVVAALARPVALPRSIERT